MQEASLYFRAFGMFLQGILIAFYLDIYNQLEKEIRTGAMYQSYTIIHNAHLQTKEQSFLVLNFYTSFYYHFSCGRIQKQFPTPLIRGQS